VIMNGFIPNTLFTNKSRNDNRFERKKLWF